MKEIIRMWLIQDKNVESISTSLGVWCSGITLPSHGRGPGFNSPHIQFFSFKFFLFIPFYHISHFINQQIYLSYLVYSFLCLVTLILDLEWIYKESKESSFERLILLQLGLYFFLALLTIHFDSQIFLFNFKIIC